MTEAELAEQMHDNPLHWAEKYQELEAENKRHRKALRCIIRDTHSPTVKARATNALEGE